MNRNSPFKSHIRWDWPDSATLLPFTPMQEAQVCRTFHTCPCGALPAVTRCRVRFLATLWKANWGGWQEAMCQRIKKILRDLGSRSVPGLLEQALSVYRKKGYCHQPTLCQKDFKQKVYAVLQKCFHRSKLLNTFIFNFYGKIILHTVRNTLENSKESGANAWAE